MTVVMILIIRLYYEVLLQVYWVGRLFALSLSFKPSWLGLHKIILSFCSMLTCLHLAVPAEFPSVLQHPKSLLLDLDPVPGKATTEH